MNEETESKMRIRNAERDLLSKIKQNPHKWRSHSMKFKVTTETSSTPSVGVQNLPNGKWSDHNFTGPFDSDRNVWKTVGRILMYENFELSLELKMKSFDWGYFLRIGNWFGLSLEKADNGTGYFLRLLQKNGLHSDGWLDTNQEPFQIHMRQWLKEF